MYLLFSGEHYYPSGGWQDFDGRYSTLNDAHKEAKKINGRWWHIVSEEYWKIVCTNEDPICYIDPDNV